MPAQRVEQAADIAGAGHMRRQPGAVQQHQPGMPVRGPDLLLMLQPLHLLGRQGDEQPAWNEIAGDRVFFHPFPDDFGAFQRHGADRASGWLAITRGDHVQRAGIAVDDLPAIAPRGAEADAHGFQDDDGKAPLGQFEGGGNAGEPGADDAHVSLFRPAQRGARILPVRRGGIIGGDMAAFTHDRPPSSSTTPSSAQTDGDADHHQPNAVGRIARLAQHFGLAYALPPPPPAPRPAPFR